MAVESTIAWAPDGQGWIAVAPVLGAADDGRLRVAASLAAIESVVGDVLLAGWHGELVLRDGRRLRISEDGDCQVVPKGDRLALDGPELAGIEPKQLQAARVELRFAPVV